MSETPTELLATETTPARSAPKTLTRNAVAVSKLKADVESDKLRLLPETGNNILEMLTEQLEHVDAWLKRAADLSHSAPLGRNPVGDAMAAKFVNRAKSDGDSFVEVLTKYRKVLEQAHDAVGDAIRRYQTIDQNAADMFQQVSRQTDA